MNTSTYRRTTVAGLAAAGARHFVVVRWLTGAADPGGAARDLRRAIDEAVPAAVDDAATEGAV